MRMVHVRVDPEQSLCDHVDSALFHATAATQHNCSEIQMSSLGSIFCQCRLSGLVHVGAAGGSVGGF